ncbi:MAG: DUF4232 domain-containing protein [Sciscionella sp.]
MSRRSRTTRGALAAGTLALGTLAAGCSSLSGAGGAPASPPAGSTTASTTGSTTVVAPPTTATSTSPDTGSSNGATSSTAACQTGHLKVSLGKGTAGAGHGYAPIEFTNAGSQACTIVAWPGVSYVAGDDGHQVGAAATREGGRGTVTTLRPGETASAALDRVEVRNFAESDCHLTAVRGLRIYPPHNTASVFLPLSGAHGCAASSLPGGQYQLAIKSVTPSAGTD